MFNILSKYVWGSNNSETSKAQEKAPNEVSAVQKGREFEPACDPDNFPTLVPNTVTARDVDNEWVFVADKGNKICQGVTPTSDKALSGAPSYASTAAKKPSNIDVDTVPKLPRQVLIQIKSAPSIVKNAKTGSPTIEARKKKDKGDSTQPIRTKNVGTQSTSLTVATIDTGIMCDVQLEKKASACLASGQVAHKTGNNSSVKEKNKDRKTPPLKDVAKVSSASETNEKPKMKKLSPSKQKSTPPVVNDTSSTTKPISPKLAKSTNESPKESRKHSITELLTVCPTMREMEKATALPPFTLVDKNVHSRDRYDRESRAVIVNENRLVTVTEKASPSNDDDTNELPRQLKQVKNGSIKSNKSTRSTKSLVAAVESSHPNKSPKNTTKNSLDTQNYTVIKKSNASETPILLGSTSPKVPRGIKNSPPSPVAWEQASQYETKRQGKKAERYKEHCFLLQEEENASPISATGKYHQIADSTNLAKGGQDAVIGQSRTALAPMARALNKFHDAWDRRSGHVDKAKAFNLAQKQALKSYNRRSGKHRRNTDDSTSSFTSALDCVPANAPAPEYLVAENEKGLKNALRRANKKMKKAFLASTGNGSTQNMPSGSSRNSLELEEAPVIDDIHGPVRNHNNLGAACAASANLLPLLDSEARHFSRKYLARKNKRALAARAARRNPFNGKFLKYLTTSMYSNPTNPCNEDESDQLRAQESEDVVPLVGCLNNVVNSDTNPSTPNSLLSFETRKGKKHTGGRFFYAQRLGAARQKRLTTATNTLKQPVPKSYNHRACVNASSKS